MRLDRKVVAHHGAFDRAAHAADVDGLSVRVPAGYADTHLVRAGGRQVGLHREAAHAAVLVRVTQVYERAFVVVQRDGFEGDPVIAGAHRTFRRDKARFEVVASGREGLHREVDAIRLVEGLVDLAADAHRELRAAFRTTLRM